MDTVTVFSGPVAEMCTAVDYYPPRRYVFWASNLEGKIFRGKLVTDCKYSFNPWLSDVDPSSLKWDESIISKTDVA